MDSPLGFLGRVAAGRPARREDAGALGGGGVGVMGGLLPVEAGRWLVPRVAGGRLEPAVPAETEAAALLARVLGGRVVGRGGGGGGGRVGGGGGRGGGVGGRLERGARLVLAPRGLGGRLEVALLARVLGGRLEPVALLTRLLGGRPAALARVFG